jgi:hypothetical protein
MKKLGQLVLKHLRLSAFIGGSILCPSAVNHRARIARFFFSHGRKK